MVTAAPARLVAQEAALRLGIGPAWGGEAGAAALLAGEFARGAFFARGEARAVGIDRSPGWEGSARVLAGGGGVGVARAGGGPRPYGLATVSFGLDPREGDRITAVGGALGYETASLPGVFAEIRYERWIQRGLRYFDIPRNVISAEVGVVVHNRRRARG